VIVIKRYTVELKPNRAQAEMFKKTADAARFAWNWGLEQRIKSYKEARKTPTDIDQHKQLNVLKKSDFKWMYEVSKSAPQCAIQDLQKAYKNFFNSLKGNNTNWRLPKFKLKSSSPSFRVNAKSEVTETHINIPRIGIVRMKEHAYIPQCKGQRDVTVKQKSITIKMSKGGR
jgi:putative transposase